jgi:dienelactone hydrolase
MRRIPGLALLLLSVIVSSASAAETVLTLTPRPGATLRVLVDRPATPVGSVVLMAGGDGVLDIDQAGAIGSGLRANHLVRTRAAYAKAGYAVFVPDIASDLKGTRGYRFGAAYGQDVAAVVAAARQVARPVAIIGTSRGALSVAAVFAKQSSVLPDAAVISSGALMGNDNAQGVGDVARIKVPVLLLRHRQDTCRVTPPGDADRFKLLLTGAPKVDIVTLDGGGPASNSADPCGASHFHGFYGIDDQAVAATVQWLAANMIAQR